MLGQADMAIEVQSLASSSGLAVALALPLVAFLVLALAGHAGRERLAPIGPVAAALALALVIVVGLAHADSLATGGTLDVIDWTAGGAMAGPHFMADGPALLVTGVALLVSLAVQAFSLAHLASDRRLGWLAAIMSLYTFAIAAAACAADLATMLAVWATAGVASMLLGAFWWESPHVSRLVAIRATCGLVADVLLGCACTVSYVAFGSASFSSLALAAAHLGAQAPAVAGAGLAQPAAASAIAVLVTLAAIVRSSQLVEAFGRVGAWASPLEPAALVSTFGPIEAGMLLALRCMPLLEVRPGCLTALAVVGAALALAGAVLACGASDVRRLWVYALSSQAGIMLVALGLSSEELALVQFVAIAFAAPLLCLGVSAVVRATGTYTLRNMGGLVHVMPGLASAMVVGLLSLAGLVPLSGYFAQDAIISTCIGRGWWACAGVLLASALATALYAGRAGSYQFLGSQRPLNTRALGSVERVCLIFLTAGCCLSGAMGMALSASLVGTPVWPDFRVSLVTTFLTALAVLVAWLVFSRDEGHSLGASVVAWHRARRASRKGGRTGGRLFARFADLVRSMTVAESKTWAMALVAAATGTAVAIWAVMGL